VTDNALRLDDARDHTLGAKRLTEMDRSTLRQLLGEAAPISEPICIPDLQQQIRGRHRPTTRSSRAPAQVAAATLVNEGSWAG
jgi:hypothetical protein